MNVAAAEGEVIWEPEFSKGDPPQVIRFAHFLRDRGAKIGNDYASLWQWSIDHTDEFWAALADFANVRMDGDTGVARVGDSMPDVRWFPGRELNFAEHLLTQSEGEALVAVSEDGVVESLTQAELRGQVAALAAHLREVGVHPGDRVVAILPNVSEAIVSFLAVAAVGAVWSVCSPEFGPGAIVSRFRQLEPTVLIAAPGYRLGGRDRDRGDEIAEVLGEIASVREVIWVTRHTPTIASPDADVETITWEQAVATWAELEFERVEFSHPLWVLFSSGTTGVPKGIVHGHGGALLEMLNLLLFGGDLRPGDRFFFVASTSWVVWNSLISALAVGAIPVLLDGNPTHPSLDRVWETAARTRATVVGVGAGFIHACAKAGLEPQINHDLSALRTVQVTGSPLSVDGFRWVYRHVGDVWLASMSGGTDIIGCFVGGAATEPVRVGYIQAPALGVSVEAWDDKGEPAKGKGELVVTKPMPSMPLRFWDDSSGSRYFSSYFDTYPGVWRHGDFIEISDLGIQILGRSDSTLNRQGIRLGSADLYSVVEALPEIVEALVVGAEIDAEGYFMPLFVKLAVGVEEDVAIEAVSAAIRRDLSARYLPDAIVPMRGIPHTKTGKKLEVPVKRLIQGKSLSDVVDLGAVDDPELLREFARYATAYLEGEG
ncbi:acetoacetate--CoA ligase [Gulosibacter macacae]|uniref:Acetoacetate--CoA ligase n=1 Tax=Gulosibacter macacae TaxID=2488791 RepID=A0A3P3VWD5_9MICO|nr:acetoacetate--CoA ligase [Gulosibacter macacae]